jgi:hypothetical protein
MKPKPLLELNHFTVPLAIVLFLSKMPLTQRSGPAKLKIEAEPQGTGSESKRCRSYIGHAG